MKYRDFLPRNLAPGWLQTPKNRAWLTASGDLKDSLADRAKSAVKARLPLEAPRDALDRIGAERQIERGPSESNQAFAARVVNAWNLWRWGGTAKGVLTAMRDAEYGGVTVAIVGGLAYQLDGDGELVIVTLPAGSWACDATPAFWSKFVVILDNTFGGDVPASDDPSVERIRRLVRRWKSAFSTCSDIVLISGKGRVWDWPLTIDGEHPRTWEGQVAAGWKWGDEGTVPYTVTHYAP